MEKRPNKVKYWRDFHIRMPVGVDGLCCKNVKCETARTVFVASTPVGEHSVVMSMSVCLSVHTHISRTTRSNCTKFSAHVA